MTFRKITYYLAILALLALTSCTSSQNQRTDDSLNPEPIKTKLIDPSPKKTSNTLIDIDNFLEDLSNKQGYDLKILKTAFDDLKPQVAAKKLVTPTTTNAKKNWRNFRNNFIEPIRLKAGQKFWEENKAFLEKTEKDTGVPISTIVGILGVETMYGSNMGNFPVRDVLNTLAFDYPNTPNKQARQTMFTEQLKDLVIYCWPKISPEAVASSDQLKTCLKQPSSFAGAIGMPQFMPSSILKYAKDGDGDGRIDLRNSSKDAIASVANFMIAHGWQKNEPIFLEINASNQSLINAQKLADGNPEPRHTLGEFKELGIIDAWPRSLNQASPSLIVDLPTFDKSGNNFVDYVVGLKNFEVITMYNRSFFYAKIVTDFGYAVEQQIKGKSVEKKSMHQATLTNLKIRPEKHRSINNGRHGRTQ